MASLARRGQRNRTEAGPRAGVRAAHVGGLQPRSVPPRPAPVGFGSEDGTPPHEAHEPIATTAADLAAASFNTSIPGRRAPESWTYRDRPGFKFGPTGQIVGIGDWVLEQACRHWSEWRKAGAAGFGLGSELFKPDYSDADIAARAQKAVAAFRSTG